MPVRVAAIEVSHWHSIYDPAYLRQLHKMADVNSSACTTDDAGVAAHRAAEVGNPPVFTDYRQHAGPNAARLRARAWTAQRHGGDRTRPARSPPALRDGEADGPERRSRSAAWCTRSQATGGYAAVPMPQRYSEFAREALAVRGKRRFRPAVAHLHPNEPVLVGALPGWNSPWMLDPAIAGGGCLRNLGAHGFDMFLLLTGENATVTAAQISHRAEGQADRGLRERAAAVGQRRARHDRGRHHVSAQDYRGRERSLADRQAVDGADGEWKIAGRDALIAARMACFASSPGTAKPRRSSAPRENPSFKVLARRDRAAGAKARAAGQRLRLLSRRSS